MPLKPAMSPNLDPCQLVWPVKKIEGYCAQARAKDPCQLAWQVNQIVGYGREAAGNLLHP